MFRYCSGKTFDVEYCKNGCIHVDLFVWSCLFDLYISCFALNGWRHALHFSAALADLDPQCLCTLKEKLKPKRKNEVGVKINVKSRRKSLYRY